MCHPRSSPSTISLTTAFDRYDTKPGSLRFFAPFSRSERGEGRFGRLGLSSSEAKEKQHAVSYLKKIESLKDVSEKYLTSVMEHCDMQR
jgi:hypothetical protein